jgi:hypothetical protein
MHLTPFPAAPGKYWEGRRCSAKFDADLLWAWWRETVLRREMDNPAKNGPGMELSLSQFKKALVITRQSTTKKMTLKIMLKFPLRETIQQILLLHV